MTQENTFTYASLFSGIGGFEQALNSLGGRCVFASEINKQANNSYEALYGHQTAGDITKVDAKDVPDHDVLVGGFPCQAFSVAGKQRGFEDVRGTLFFEIARIVKEKRPKALLLENVKGLLGHEKGQTIQILILTLKQLGYKVDLGLVNSSEMGLPQHRERVFFLCVREDLAQGLTPREKGMIQRPTMTRVIKLLKGKELQLDEMQWPTPSPTVPLDSFLDTISDTTQYFETEHIQNILDNLKPREVVEGWYAGDLNELTQLIKTTPYITRAIITPAKVTVRHNGRRFKEENEPSHTLTCLDKHGVLLIFGNKVFGRLFTIEELFKLQGFSPNTYPTLVATGITPPQLYKQIGNAVSVPVIREVAKMLLPFLNQETSQVQTKPQNNHETHIEKEVEHIG